MNEAEKLKSTLSSIFRRKGANGRFTRLFEDLEPLQKEALLKKTPLHDGELPIIGSMENQDTWLMVTTERLVWQSKGQAQNLTVKDIWHAKMDMIKMMAKGIRKHQLRELQIETTTHDERIIEIEEGPPLFGVWNVLLNLGTRNRKKE